MNYNNLRLTINLFFYHVVLIYILGLIDYMFICYTSIQQINYQTTKNYLVVYSLYLKPILIEEDLKLRSYNLLLKSSILVNIILFPFFILNFSISKLIL